MARFTGAKRPRHCGSVPLPPPMATASALPRPLSSEGAAQAVDPLEEVYDQRNTYVVLFWGALVARKKPEEPGRKQRKPEEPRRTRKKPEEAGKTHVWVSPGCSAVFCLSGHLGHKQLINVRLGTLLMKHAVRFLFRMFRVCRSTSDTNKLLTSDSGLCALSTPCVFYGQ